MPYSQLIKHINNKPNVEDGISTSLILFDECPPVFYNNHNCNEIYWDLWKPFSKLVCFDFVPIDGLPSDIHRQITPIYFIHLFFNPR